MGPEALRVARLGERLAKRGMHVVDRGNVAGPLNPWLPPTDGYRHLGEVVAWNTAVHEAFYAELSAGKDRKSTRLNSSHEVPSRMPSSA